MTIVFRREVAFRNHGDNDAQKFKIQKIQDPVTPTQCAELYSPDSRRGITSENDAANKLEKF